MEHLAYLKDMDKCFSKVQDSLKNGVFLRVENETEAYEFEKSLGHVEAFESFACSYRFNSFFMSGKCGNAATEIPKETHWLIIKHTDNSYTLLLPLIDEPIRATLGGKENGTLTILFETGDKGTVTNHAEALFISHGNNPYTLMERAGYSVQNKLGGCKRREEKPLPKFMQYFGWCTWDSFYEKVSQDLVREGLESFRKGGFAPKFLLLDDGWQTVNDRWENRGHHKLKSFTPNEKFNQNLKDTVKMAKDEYGVEMFYVWHAIMGYWGGVDKASLEMAPYHIRSKQQTPQKTLCDNMPDYAASREFQYGFVDPDKAFPFYNDYHRYLSTQGVDGVKVDVQTELETVADGEGGRVTVARKYHEALEGSVHVHMNGELINCMSHINDIIYNTKGSNMMRSSGDFFPDNPASHGLHILDNAFNSMWLGEFTHCDWDMFQTAHPCGKFHAAARAVSGSPIYVSDKPEGHDFSLIEKLCLSDGTLPLAKKIARPTLDSLFVNPYQSKTLFIIFNYNPIGGVIAAFNVGNEEGTGGEEITGTIQPSDINGFTDGSYAVYLHQAQKLITLTAKEAFEITLQPLEFEVFTVVKIENGVAPIGLTKQFNSGATMQQYLWQDEQTLRITVKDGGNWVAYCENEPKQFLVNGKPCAFTFENNMLIGSIAEQGMLDIVLQF